MSQHRSKPVRGPDAGRPGDVTVRGKNLTNAFYVDWAPTANQVLIGMPRVFEASYQFKF